MQFYTANYVRWLIAAFMKAGQIPPTSQWLDGLGEGLAAMFSIMFWPIPVGIVIVDAIRAAWHYSQITVAEAQKQTHEAERAVEYEKTRQAQIELERGRLAAEAAEAERKRVEIDLHNIGRHEAAGKRFEQQLQEWDAIGDLPIDADTKAAMRNKKTVDAIQDMMKILRP